MSERRTHGDEILFITALTAFLVGLGFLLKNAGIAHGFRTTWPIAVLAVGSLLLFFSVVRGQHSTIIFSGGAFFALFGVFFLVAGLFGWRFEESWPLITVSAGGAWFVSGLRHFRRLKAGFFAPALGFILLGVFFCLFSFDVIPMSFGRFVVTWWPSFLVVGGIVLFAVYGVTRKGRRETADDE